MQSGPNVGGLSEFNRDTGSTSMSQHPSDVHKAPPPVKLEYNACGATLDFGRVTSLEAPARKVHRLDPTASNGPYGIGASAQMYGVSVVGHSVLTSTGSSGFGFKSEVSQHRVADGPSSAPLSFDLFLPFQSEVSVSAPLPPRIGAPDPLPLVKDDSCAGMCGTKRDQGALLEWRPDAKMTVSGATSSSRFNHGGETFSTCSE
jgi:hypothetical protein